ncbi:sugar ABC transporter substrate-binding protein [Sphaerisporangium melleum]|uniref:Sugar ABC transporter substrate-binding protein n=1 Tax=Sphaerisporangium melleum TaxID=321316 RepID=A0A917QWV4_9ACTN|nr:extracellular solute-binding protein [Sphaerisporangium melleum]GGK74546.1 sugar ABC transporter substrate-binding protein [Sphaerisporangium melleum]GII70931.1 sugar ABC transporter substrate-binding protein [Sphaerisporangium melleum]
MKKSLFVTAAMLTAATALAACSPDAGKGTASGGTEGGNNASSCTNTITKKDLPVVTMWGWYPNTQLVVDNFNKQNNEVQVCWTNVGQGGDEYQKFQTAISAGTGAPDVIMVEMDRIPTFQIQNALVDIKKYGYDAVKANYSEGAWKDVSVGDAVYGVPVDGGPMAMIYRKDIFDKYKITPPKTWAEYEQAAQKVKDAGGPNFGDFGSNVAAVTMALQIQKGATPFTYDPAQPKSIGIKLNDQASKDVLDYWGGLAKKGLVGTQDQFTPEYIAGVINGKYATYISAAWAPGYLTGAGVGKGKDTGKFAVAPLPQWDAANPVHVNWGGSAFSVTSQAKNPELAAKVAYGIYADDASLTDGWTNQIIFPLNLKALKSPEFVDLKVQFFDGQQANKEVYVPAADGYKGVTYSPFGQYYFDALTKQISAIIDGSVSGAEAADRLQEDVVNYAKEQGFTVQ